MTLHKNLIGLQIWTDNGWSNFDGVVNNGVRPIVQVQIDNGTVVKCTADHKFFTEGLIKIQAKDLTGKTVISSDGTTATVLSVTDVGSAEVFDAVNVELGNRFYADDILVSNCEFVIFDETLISPLHLTTMKGHEPIERQGQVRWYEKPTKDMTYLVALDPSLGTGGDDAAIQIFQLQGMKQVGEWMHNRTPITQQVGIMREINKYIYEITQDPTSIYYTVENNTIGEAALNAIAEIGEENIFGTFLSEPARAGQTRRYRKGFNTSNTKKIAACARLKHWIETGKMAVVSNPLISELKSYVANGPTFAAKVGEKDDLVAACLLIVNMAQFLKSYDPDIATSLSDNLDTIIDPMPFVIL